MTAQPQNNDKMKWQYEQEFRLDNPQTVGETDSYFDLDNYKDWLENKLTEARLSHVKETAMLEFHQEQGQLEIEAGADCMYCGELVPGAIPKYCCTGSQCGCMGLPIEPIVCSKGCYEMLTSSTTNYMKYALTQIAQFSDVGSEINAIIDMKKIASEALNSLKENK